MIIRYIRDVAYRKRDIHLHIVGRIYKTLQMQAFIIDLSGINRYIHCREGGILHMSRGRADTIAIRVVDLSDECLSEVELPGAVLGNSGNFDFDVLFGSGFNLRHDICFCT